MTPEDEGKVKAHRNYRILAVVLGILGATLLIFGIVSVVRENENDEDTFGPPFYVGGFVVGITIQGQFMLSIFMIMGCFAGTVLAGVGGFGFSHFRENKDYYYYVKQKYAAAILALCIISLFVTICSLCTLCTMYKSYFGVAINNRRGARVVIWTNTGTGNAVITQTQTFGNYPTNATGFGMGSASNDQIRQLQEQNRLLQEQLELQRQLQQNQNPQQNLYGGGYYPPPPPPSYGFSGGLSAPPPSYGTVK